MHISASQFTRGPCTCDNADNGTQLLKGPPSKNTHDYLIYNPQDTDGTEAWEGYGPKLKMKVQRTLN